MAESLILPNSTDRKIIYGEVLSQIESLISGETDVIANLANVAAVLKEAFGFFWIGFYFVKHDQLVLGPFQGPLACTRINFDEGVCGRSYTFKETVIVPDVDKFQGHIACSSAARSEIVLPVLHGDGKVFGVLDVDSDRLNDFSSLDADGLGRIVKVIEKTISRAQNTVTI